MNIPLRGTAAQIQSFEAEADRLEANAALLLKLPLGEPAWQATRGAIFEYRALVDKLKAIEKK